MTADEVLARLRSGLNKAIASHKGRLEKVTDTGVMWRLSAYEEVLKCLDDPESMAPIESTASQP